MTGGCISMWHKAPIAQTRIRKLNNSVLLHNNVSDIHIDFHILPEQKINNPSEINSLIGYVPKFEIDICGNVTSIFPIAEAILREYGGYLKISSVLTGDELSTYSGIAIPLGSAEDQHLMDWEFVCNYFNNGKVNTLAQVFK